MICESSVLAHRGGTYAVVGKAAVVRADEGGRGAEACEVAQGDARCEGRRFSDLQKRWSAGFKAVVAKVSGGQTFAVKHRVTQAGAFVGSCAAAKAESPRRTR